MSLCRGKAIRCSSKPNRMHICHSANKLAKTMTGEVCAQEEGERRGRNMKKQSQTVLRTLLLSGSDFELIQNSCMEAKTVNFLLF